MHFPPPLTSQIRTVLSLLHEAILVASGDHALALTCVLQERLTNRFFFVVVFFCQIARKRKHDLPRLHGPPAWQHTRLDSCPTQLEYYLIHTTQFVRHPVTTSSQEPAKQTHNSPTKKNKYVIKIQSKTILLINFQ
jgi:hypothetical protein